MNKHTALVKLLRGLEVESIELPQQIKKDLEQIKRKIKIRTRNK